MIKERLQEDEVMMGSSERPSMWVGNIHILLHDFYEKFKTRPNKKPKTSLAFLS